jgi:hypothetical protein
MEEGSYDMMLYMLGNGTYCDNTGRNVNKEVFYPNYLQKPAADFKMVEEYN